MIMQIALVSSNGSYLVAEGGGGREVLANRDGIGPWETFCLFNRSRSGQTPVHGDQVVLQAWNGQFVTAESGGGGAMHAELPWIEAANIFTIERVTGAGEIRSDEQVAFRAANGNYVVAEGGGGGVVNANRVRRQSWEAFTLKIFQPQLIRLRSSNNRYVTAEGGGAGPVTANREVVGLWETFSLINLSRPDGIIRAGDSIALQAWNGNYIRVASSGSMNVRANRATGDALFKVVASSEEEIGHSQRLSLQSLTTSQFVVARAEVLVANSSSITDETQFTIELAEQGAINFRWIPRGSTLPGRPFASAPPPVSGEHNLLIMHFYDDTGTSPLTASNDQIHNGIFGPAPSLASWLQAMSEGVLRISGNVYGPIRLSSVPSADMSELLTAAENAGVPLSSFANDDGLIDNTRVKLIKLGQGSRAQNTPVNGISRSGIRFAGIVLGVGVSPDVNEPSRMVLAHEISHLLFNVADRYGQRRPIRGDVVADRTWVGDWEKFVIERVSGAGRVLNGDQIMLRAHNRLHVSVALDPPPLPLPRNLINTEGPEAGEARVFTILNLDGRDLVSGTRIALRSSVGTHVTAVAGGNSVLVANAPWTREWESFEISKRPEGGSDTSSGDTVSLKTSGGFYVVAETNARDRPRNSPRNPQVDEKDKQRGCIWGAGMGQGGKFDNSSSNASTVMLSLWDRLRLGWTRPRFLAPDNRGCYQLRPFIDSREALILFDPLNPKEWYTVENRQQRENVDEVPSSGIVISWLCEDEGYWQWWFNRANDPDVGNYHALYPAVISAAASEVPPNAMARPVVFNDELITKRNDTNAAFRNQELVLPLGNGDPSRFHLSFHAGAGPNVTMCVR